MKSIIFAAVLALALCSPIEFAQDSNEEGAFGILTKGFFNPTTSGENKIESFLRLANELIPLAEMKSSRSEPQGQRLGLGKQWCTGQEGDLFNACVTVTADLWIGWNVTQNGTVGSYSVTYTPFTYLRAGAGVLVESYPAQVGYGGYVSFVNIQIPIFALVGQN
jgi:hypothetical protein